MICWYIGSPALELSGRSARVDMFMDQTLQKVESVLRLRPNNILAQLREYSAIESSYEEHNYQASQAYTQSQSSYEMPVMKPQPQQHGNGLKMSPLKVRKTRENLSSAAWKSEMSAPILDKLQAGGELKYRGPAPVTYIADLPRDTPSLSRKKENADLNPSKMTIPLYHGPRELTTPLTDYENDSCSTLDAKML